MLNAADVEDLFENTDQDNSQNSHNSQSKTHQHLSLEQEALYGLAGDIVKAIEPSLKEIRWRY